MVCYGALKYNLLSNVQDNPDLQFQFKFGHDIYSSVMILDTIWRKSSFEAQAGFKDTLCWSLKVHIHLKKNTESRLRQHASFFKCDCCQTGVWSGKQQRSVLCAVSVYLHRLILGWHVPHPPSPSFWKVWHRPSAHHLKPLLTWETGRPLQIASSPPRPCWCKDSV